VVIDAEVGKDDHSLIACTAIGRGLKPLDVITDLTNHIRQSSGPDTGGQNKNKKNHFSDLLNN
jgi:hypothetical protein